MRREHNLAPDSHLANPNKGQTDGTSEGAMSRFFQVAASRPALVGNGRHRSNRHMKSSQPRRQAPYETPCKQRVRSSSAFTPSGLPSIELPGPAYLGFGQRGPLPTSSQPPPLTPTPHTKRNQRDLSSSKTQYTWSLSPATAERASKPDRAGKDQFQLRQWSSTFRTNQFELARQTGRNSCALA